MKRNALAHEGILLGIVLGLFLASTAPAVEKEDLLKAVSGIAREKGMIDVAAFDMAGSLALPTGYREWVFVGAPVTPNDLNSGKAAFPEFHHVYIDPGSYRHFRETGKFRDGTVLVKELAGVGKKQAASGNGYFPGDYVGLAVAVKDAKRFASEPGNWAYFDFTGERGRLKPSAAALPTASCNPCHQKNAAEDWVFTQFYPVLRADRPAKK